MSYHDPVDGYDATQLSAKYAELGKEAAQWKAARLKFLHGELDALLKEQAKAEQRVKEIPSELMNLECSISELSRLTGDELMVKIAGLKSR